jgi:hypothetical protein
MSEISVFLFAYFGGAAINVIRLSELYNTPKNQRPATFKDPYYLVQFFIIPIIGGILAYAYQISGQNLTPLLTINIGASAPLIIKSLAAAAPPIGQRNVD